MNVKTLNIENLNREQIRSKVLRTWESELAKSVVYRYNVEECADGSQIYLLRPANLNKGCGFLLTIPTSKEQPSLNLAQSVLIVAYELSKAGYAGGKGQRAKGKN